MRFGRVSFGILLLLGVIPVVRANDNASSATSSDQRVAWTSSRMRGSPDPPSPYRTQPAFPELRFDEPVAMTTVFDSIS